MTTMNEERAREAFEAELGSALLAEQGKFALSRAYDEGRPYTFLATKWAFAGFQAGAAWQRMQAAPTGEREARTPMPEILCGPSTHVTWTPFHTPKDQRRRVVIVDAEQFATWQRTQPLSVPVDRIKIALEAVQNAMEDAYNNAYQNCCGRGIGQCCGDPEPAWSDADQAIMDALAPAQRELSALLAAAPAQPAAQEPIAWLDPSRGLDWLVDRVTVAPGTKLYAHAPAAQDQGEVQRLRKLICEASDELQDWRLSFPDANSLATDRLLERIENALAASTGQEA